MTNTEKGLLKDVLGYSEEEIARMSEQELGRLANKVLNDVNTYLPTLEKLVEWKRELNNPNESRIEKHFLDLVKGIFYDIGIITGLKKAGLNSEKTIEKFKKVLSNRGPHYELGRGLYTRLDNILENLSTKDENYFLALDHPLAVEPKCCSLLSKAYRAYAKSCERSTKRDKAYKELAERIKEEELTKNE